MGAVSESVAHRICRMFRLLEMLLLTTIVVFVKSTRSPRVLAAKKGKVIDHREANSCEEGNDLAKRCESEGSVGSNP